jgi:hypothetical protein
MRHILAPKGSVTFPTALRGVRDHVTLDNRQRTVRLLVTIAAVLTVAGAPAGAVRNGGMLSNCVQFAVNENGEDTWGVVDGFLVRALAEFRSAQPLGGTFLPASGALPIAAYTLRETFPIDFADPRCIDPMETAFMEQDPSSFFQLDMLVNANAENTLVAPAGGSTVTLGPVTLTVTQDFATGAAGSYPLFKPRVREISQVVAGVNPADILYVKTNARLRALTVGAIATAADGGSLIVSDVMNALRLIGDSANGNVIGPNQMNYADLVNFQRAVAGGNVSNLNAFLTSYFADNGRLGNTIVPVAQFPNFRYEFNDQPSASGSTRIVALMEELVRKAPVNGYATVAPELPAWLTRAMPLLAGAAVLAGGATDLLGKIGGLSDIGGALGFSDTKTDKARIAAAQKNLSLALAGDLSAVRRLQYEAFERRTGAPGDVRTPVDNKYSPDDTRNLAVKALKAYYTATGQQPPAEYAAKLKLPAPAPRANVIQQLVAEVSQPVLEQIGGAAVDVATERATDKAKAAVPYVLLGLAGVVVLVLMLRKAA